MKQKNPILSIVIPTKDRYPYLFLLLDYLISLPVEKVEIVLQDNNEDNSPIQAYFKKIGGIPENFIYNHISEQIPIYLNSDYAILNSHGKYICFIGDDDGITKSIIDCAEWMDKNGIEIVVPEIVRYNWPDNSDLAKKANGILSYDQQFTGEVKQVDCGMVLDDLIKIGFRTRGKLPLTYHGIVARKTLDKINSKCGTFFPGASPDIANGVALSLIASKYYLVSYPLIISGASASHGGGAGKDTGVPIEKVPFLPKDAKEKWDKRIPPMWTGPTVSADSAIKALERMGRNDLIELIDFNRFYADLIVYNPALKKLTFNIASNKLGVFYQISKSQIERVYLYTKRKFLKLFGLKSDFDRITINNVKDICEAISMCENMDIQAKYLTSSK